MRVPVKKGVAAATAAVAVTAAIFVGSSGGTAAAAVPNLSAFGLIGDGRTMCAFNTTTPTTLNWVRDVSGFAGGETRLIGLDIRVQDNVLYAVGDKGGIYTIAVGDEYATLTKVSQLTVAPHGVDFGVDFNPAADRLRVIGDNGQNLRHDLNTHTTVADSALNSGGTTAKGVTAAAYTNNDLNSDTATTLFDLNTINDQVVVQAPPNSGPLNATGKVGVDVGANAGLDIFSDLSGGRTTSNTAFAAFVPAGGARASFYSIDVLTGTATKVGDFPSIAPVTEVAVALDAG
ncbi:DUF4394 domain-containing protein [Saccharothrix xinjiangensis]|uniref:DUF4394 domain-containing protein n=1 Tax=Saccharothrix xinjiangensis TaxID=204798 RepID=A0ABV9Y2J5_9PSEU